MDVTAAFLYLALAAFVVSLLALLVSSRRYGQWKLKKRIDELCARQIHTESMLEKYEHDQRKLLARVSMRQHRAKEKEKPENGQMTEAEALRWKQSVSGLRKN